MLFKCLELLAVAVIAYLIGSIPTGYIIVKAKTGNAPFSASKSITKKSIR